MKQLYIVGLPITPETVTEEFLSILKFKEPTIFLMSTFLDLQNKESLNDYVTARVGFDKLISSGLTFTNRYKENLSNHVFMMNSVWYQNGVRRRVSDVASDILFTMLKLRQLQDANVVYIVPGSPHHYDSVSPLLVSYLRHSHGEDIKVVDTKSSAQLTYELFDTSIPLNIVDCFQIEMKKYHINVIGCLGEIYATFVNRERFFNWCKKFSQIHEVKLGYHSHVNQLTHTQLYEKLVTERKSLNDSTFSVF